MCLFFHTARASSTLGSSDTVLLRKMRLWRSRVLAAEAKKANGASETTLRIPRPPSLISRLAWVQLCADSALLVILHKTDLRSESKVDSWVVPAWCGPQRVQNFGSAEKRAQDDEGVVC